MASYFCPTADQVGSMRACICLSGARRPYQCHGRATTQGQGLNPKPIPPNLAGCASSGCPRCGLPAKARPRPSPTAGSAQHLAPELAKSRRSNYQLPLRPTCLQKMSTLSDCSRKRGYHTQAKGFGRPGLAEPC